MGYEKSFVFIETMILKTFEANLCQMIEIDRYHHNKEDAYGELSVLVDFSAPDHDQVINGL